MSDELQGEELRRTHATNLAIAYYRDLARAPMFLPKRDDVDLAVEIKPTVHELLATADAIDDYIALGIVPPEGDT